MRSEISCDLAVTSVTTLYVIHIDNNTQKPDFALTHVFLVGCYACLVVVATEPRGNLLASRHTCLEV